MLGLHLGDGDSVEMEADADSSFDIDDKSISFQSAGLHQDAPYRRTVT